MTLRDSQATPEMHLQRADLMLEGARLLLEREHYNSAADRAFYALFHAAAAAVRRHGGTVYATHGSLRNMFGQFVVRPGYADPRSSRLLATTLRLRQDCTYDPNVFIAPEQAQQLVSQADAFVAAMKRLVSSS